MSRSSDVSMHTIAAAEISKAKQDHFPERVKKQNEEEFKGASGLIGEMEKGKSLGWGKR